MIETSHLHYRYGPKSPAVFEDLTFHLEPGRVYGLLGKNGTGKSTLLHLLSGLLFPQQGSVKYRGMEMRERRPEALRDLYLLPETFRLPNVSLKRYVKLNASFYPNYSETLLCGCLNEFDLPFDVTLGELSMGQQKKVVLSFALATNTPLLLLDEPSNGLDIPSKSQFRRAVARAMTDERTVVISTHQVADVETLIDRVAIIDGARLLFDRRVEDITQRLAFRMVESGETAQPLYSQHVLGGDAGVFVKQAGEEETKLNLELLFNAALTAGDKLDQIFTDIKNGK
jgi:ABC-2 type transport system ATP-binding protein